MPGPMLAVGIAETPKNGWQTGPAISVGHAVSEIIVVAILSIGITALTDNSTVTRTIGIVGGLALVYMSVTMGIDAIRDKIEYDGVEMQQSSLFKLGAKGFTASLSNPYWFVWWATIGLALIVQSKSLGVAGPVVFYFGHVLSDFVWYTAVSILIWNGRKLIMGTGLKILLLTCAAFLLYLGISFIYDGITGAI